jgi:probable HAF family extracellular repeat protein
MKSKNLRVAALCLLVVGATGVVHATTYGSGSHATIWNGTTPTALGTLPGWQDSLAVGINDLGQVVGYSRGNGSTKATIWDGTTPIDLSTLLGRTGAGWTLSQATAINSLGQIVGWGFNRLGLQRGFLLTPKAR